MGCGAGPALLDCASTGAGAELGEDAVVAGGFLDGFGGARDCLIGRVESFHRCDALAGSEAPFP